MIADVRRASVAATMSLLAAMPLVACGDERATTASPPTAPATSSSVATTAAPADRDADGIPDSIDTYPDDPKNTPQQAPISLSCYLDDDFTESAAFTVGGDRDGRPDFTTLWAAKPVSCEVDDTVAPVTDLEQKAYRTSKYDDNDISTLYTICAEVDPTDPYAEAGFAASTEQIPEINAALTLCPKHPLAAKWRQAVQRGKADADLEAQGRLFGPGTFLVNKEIRPGRYVTMDVEGCYWERQNRSGGTIDNNFVTSARRVQVTIRSTDFAFHSERCGQWRPAH